jgi:hypothetical protein
VAQYDPTRQVLTLLTALGELSTTLNSPDAGPERWSLASYDLCTVVTVAAGLASHFDVPPYRRADWPDGTPVGGEGTDDPHRLLADLVTAAGWVAEWAREPGSGLAWLSAVPVTELLARTWSLADRLSVREPLWTLVQEALSPAGPPAAAPCP